MRSFPSLLVTIVLYLFLQIINEILDVASSLLAEAKPLSLTDGRNFSPFAGKQCMHRFTCWFVVRKCPGAANHLVFCRVNGSCCDGAACAIRHGSHFLLLILDPAACASACVIARDQEQSRVSAARLGSRAGLAWQRARCR